MICTFSTCFIMFGLFLVHSLCLLLCLVQKWSMYFLAYFDCTRKNVSLRNIICSDHECYFKCDFNPHVILKMRLNRVALIKQNKGDKMNYLNRTIEYTMPPYLSRIIIGRNCNNFFSEKKFHLISICLKRKASQVAHKTDTIYFIIYQFAE